MRDKLLLRLATVIALAIAGFGAWASYGHAATTTVIAPTYGYDHPGTFVHSVSSSPLHQAGSAASRAARVEGAFEPIGFVTGVAAEEGTAGARLGQTVAPLGRTYEGYDTYLTDVARHYGINLRGVNPVFDYSLSPGVKGLTRASEGGWKIRINPGFANESDLANTLAHELSHARDFQKGLSSAEAPAYASGDALEEWINGLR